MLLQLHSLCGLLSIQKMFKLRHAWVFCYGKVGERVYLRNEWENIYSPSPDAIPLIAKTENPMVILITIIN